MKKFIIILIPIIVIFVIYLFLNSRSGQAIIIELNQEEYAQEDTLSPIIKNVSIKILWYHLGCIMPYWTIEELVDTKWKSIHLSDESNGDCPIAFCAPLPPQKLLPGDILEHSISIDNVCVNRKPGGLNTGTYRIKFKYYYNNKTDNFEEVYSKPFEIK